MGTSTTYNNNNFILSTNASYAVPSFNARPQITVKNTASTNITLTATGSETIDGSATLVLKGLAAVNLVKGENEAGEIEWVVTASGDAARITDGVATLNFGAGQ